MTPAGGGVSARRRHWSHRTSARGSACAAPRQRRPRVPAAPPARMPLHQVRLGIASKRRLQQTNRRERVCARAPPPPSKSRPLPRSTRSRAQAPGATEPPPLLSRVRRAPAAMARYASRHTCSARLPSQTRACAPGHADTRAGGGGGGGGRGVHGLYGARQAARAGCDATRLGQGQAPVPSRTCNCLLPDVGARSRPPDCPSPSLSPYPGCCRVLGCACACVRACTDVLSPARAPTHGAPMRHGAPSSALFRAAARAAAQRVVPRGGAGGGGGGAGAGRGGRGALLQQELAGLMREERRLPWLLPQRSAGQRALLHGVVRLRRRCAMLDGQQECLLVRQRRRRRVALQVPQSGAQGPPRRLATERRHAVQPGLLRRR